MKSLLIVAIILSAVGANGAPTKAELLDVTRSFAFVHQGTLKCLRVEPRGTSDSVSVLIYDKGGVSRVLVPSSLSIISELVRTELPNGVAGKELFEEDLPNLLGLYGSTDVIVNPTLMRQIALYLQENLDDVRRARFVELLQRPKPKITKNVWWFGYVSLGGEGESTLKTYAGRLAPFEICEAHEDVLLPAYWTSRPDQDRLLAEAAALKEARMRSLPCLTRD